MSVKERKREKIERKELPTFNQRFTKRTMEMRPNIGKKLKIRINAIFANSLKGLGLNSLIGGLPKTMTPFC